MILKNPTESERLDRYLSKALSYSREEVKKMIKKKLVLVDSKPSKASYLLKSSDIVELLEIKTSQKNIPKNKSKLDVLYEDSEIIVINKGRGLLVHNIDKDDRLSLAEILKGYTCSLSNAGGKNRDGIVHRLDLNTEGLMIIAKNNSSHEFIKKQFKERTIIKKYYAVIQGNLIADHKTIKQSIARHNHKKRLFKVTSADDKNGKEAITDITVLKRYQTKTLLSVSPKTGRTHQIRVHLAFIGHPIIGDPNYGLKKGDGQKLQAYFIKFMHPKTNKYISVEIPISKYLIT